MLVLGFAKIASIFRAFWLLIDSQNVERRNDKYLDETNEKFEICEYLFGRWPASNRQPRLYLSFWCCLGGCGTGHGLKVTGANFC